VLNRLTGKSIEDLAAKLHDDLQQVHQADGLCLVYLVEIKS